MPDNPHAIQPVDVGDTIHVYDGDDAADETVSNATEELGGFYDNMPRIAQNQRIRNADVSGILQEGR